ncbi:MAG: cadherin repeat domain-containing protein [Pirellulaceae bacterium]
MTKREKILAAAVGLMVLTLGTLFVSQRIGSEFQRRENSLTQLTQDVENQDRIIRLGKEAAHRLGDYAERSLLPDPALARSLYQDWLLDQAVETGLSGVNVSPLPSRPVGEVYFQHSFLVSGRGDLHKLVRFLYGFYDKGYLHRIRTLRAKRIARSKELDLSITVEALSMMAAPKREDLHDPPAVRPHAKELDAYITAIVNRNMLAYANKPPRISSVGSQKGSPGSSVRFRVRAEDPDELDKLTFRLSDSTLEGARIDPNSGEFEWVPQELGEYEISVCVTDNGLPAKTHTETVKIAVVEASAPVETPPALGLDAARHSVVTGITEASGRREIWVSVRTEGRLLKLAEGDEVSIGSVQGVVSRIERSQVEIKTNDGQVIVVGLGKSLRPSESTPPGEL